MAYNPFNIFRRNQKAIFAVITVFIMFTFVLSSGLGGGHDFFDWFPSMFRKKGDAVCTLDGSKVYDAELSKLRFRRVMANRFMDYAADEASTNVQNTLRDRAASLTPQFRAKLQIILSDPRLLEQVLDENPSKPLPAGLALSADEKDVLRAIQAAQVIGQMRQVSASQGRHFFVNAPNRTNRDLVDFMIWLKKADQMKIRFTEDDIKALIRKEFFGQFKTDVQVRKLLEKEMQGFSLDAAIKAIGDEFRVRAVQTALLGPVIPIPREDSTLSAPPLFTPPYELYDYYRDKLSATTFWVIGVPAANFADRVPPPSDAELFALFDKYQNQEYDPSREEPGFKLPRKARVEWISATGTEPYYQNKAREWVAKAEQFRHSEIGGFAVPLAGIGPGLATHVPGPGQATDPLIWAQYQAIIDRHRAAVGIDWESSQFVIRPIDTSVVRPQNLVAGLGGLGGGLGGGGGPYQPFSMAYGGAMFFENRDRIKAGLPLLWAGVPGPGMQGTMFGGAAASRLAVPLPLPLDAHRPALIQQVTDDKARELALTDLRKLKTDLQQLAKDVKTPAERTAKAKDMIAAFIKERGLSTGATTDLRDEWTIGDDPGMAQLKAAYLKLLGPNQPPQFGKKFFWTDDFSKVNFQDPKALKRAMAGDIPKSPASGVYQADFFPGEPGRLSGDETTFLFWRTEEQPARTMTRQQAKDSGLLLKAWQRIKGRELAQARANQIANELRGRSATSGQQVLQNVFDADKVLRVEFGANEKALERIKLFDLEKVSPLVASQDTNPFGGGGGTTLEPFELEPSANIPYPTAEMTKTLVDERTKPLGTVLVLADRPKDMVYVVVLTNRRVLTPKDFSYEVYSPLGGQRGLGGAVRSSFNRDAAKSARESVLDLLKKEFEYSETDAQKKKLDGDKDTEEQ
jgi:hypothetical protein